MRRPPSLTAAPGRHATSSFLIVLSAWQELGVVEVGRQKLTACGQHDLVVIAEDRQSRKTSPRKKLTPHKGRAVGAGI